MWSALAFSPAIAGVENASRHEGMKEGEVPAIIHAKILDYQKVRNVIIGEGYVDIYYGTMRLQADRVELNTETKQVTAQGNAILDEGTNRLTGERMDLNIETKIGTIYRGAGYVEAGYYFSGDIIERIGSDEYLITNGTYTSCEPPAPGWQFKAKKCRIHVENYAYLTDFTMNIKDVPVLYFPYGVFPIKTKRSSGFLIPRLGYSNTDGFMFKEKYFWAINDWSDMTFGIDYNGKRGVGENFEGRYALTGRDNGQINMYHIRDQITLQERWQVQGNTNQQMPGGVSGIFRLDTFSDRQFDRQLADDLAVRNRQEQESYFSFTKNWDSYNLNLWGNYAQDLYQTQKTIQQRMPELNFNSIPQRLGESPFFVEWETAMAALETRTGHEITQRTQRANFHPRLSLPWTIREGWVFTPSAGRWDTWYSDTPQGDSVTRNLYDLKLAMDGPQTYRIYDTPGWGSLQRVKHLFYPNITYTYIPYADQAKIYNFDQLDRVNPAYKIDYSLTNHFLGKFLQEDSSTQIRDMLTLTLSQTFDLAEERRMVDLNTRPRRPFSDLKVDVEFKPVPAFRIDYESFYNVYDHYIDRVNIDAWLNDPKQIWALNGGWRYAKLIAPRTSRTDMVNAGGSLRLAPWTLNGSFNYNLWDKQRVEVRAELIYTSQCWSVSLTHVSRPAEDEFGLMFSFKGLGTVGQAK
ncbi:MAG: LPS-assembly protein LptD [Candidatus Schekmanbacteria bacterium]|nr:LPS-assembly protein LptD [Candidatus Schekmanbacteria bacterium]